MFKIPTDPMLMFIIPTQTPVLKTNKVGIVNTNWSISQISALYGDFEDLGQRLKNAKERLPVSRVTKSPVFIRACPYIGAFVENRPYNARVFVILPVFL